MSNGVTGQGGLVSAAMSPQWLLRSSGPVSVRLSGTPDGVEAQQSLRCQCGRDADWLIAADPQRVLFVCRCGRRSLRQGLALSDVVALVEAEPIRPQWSDIDEAAQALGFGGVREGAGSPSRSRVADHGPGSSADPSPRAASISAW